MGTLDSLISIPGLLIGVALYCFATLIRECWQDYKKAKRKRRRSLSIEEFIKLKDEDDH